MLKYINRHIIFTDTNIISIDLQGTKVHGTVAYYDRETGTIERSCEYIDNLPCGMYREFQGDRVVHERHYVDPEHLLRTTATICAEYALAD